MGEITLSDSTLAQRVAALEARQNGNHEKIRDIGQCVQELQAEVARLTAQMSILSDTVAEVTTKVSSLDSRVSGMAVKLGLIVIIGGSIVNAAILHFLGGN